MLIVEGVLWPAWLFLAKVACRDPECRDWWRLGENKDVGRDAGAAAAGREAEDRKRAISAAAAVAIAKLAYYRCEKAVLQGRRRGVPRLEKIRRITYVLVFLSSHSIQPTQLISEPQMWTKQENPRPLFQNCFISDACSSRYSCYTLSAPSAGFCENPGFLKPSLF